MSKKEHPERENQANNTDGAKQPEVLTGTPAEEGAPVIPDPAGQENKSLEKTTEEKLAEMNDKYVRLYAEFDNFRKRAAKERIDLLKFAGEDVYKQLIPVIDDFDRAMKASEKVSDVKTIREGVQLIYNKFKNMLTQAGVAEMNATGKVFDPEIHDAVTNVPAPSADMKGKVVDEVEKGYWLNGKVLRHAKVVVGQ